MKILGLSAVVLLAGCSFIPKPDVETRYVLQPVPALHNDISSHTEKRVLKINRPDIPVDLRGNQFVLIKNGELTYYSGKAWSAPLTDTLNAALVRDLAASLPNFIVTGDNGLRKDVELQTEIHQFATVQDETGTSVQMNIDIRIVNPLERSVIKVIPFRYRGDIAELSTSETLRAYNEGWKALIQSILTEMAGIRI